MLLSEVHDMGKRHVQWRYFKTSFSTFINNTLVSHTERNSLFTTMNG